MKEHPNAAGPFSGRTLFWIFAVGGTCFFGALFFTVFADLFQPSGRGGANSYSWSALGHRAFVRLLTDTGLDVEVSRRRSAEKAGSTGLVVLAEPPAPASVETILTQTDDSSSILVVLPKWKGVAHPQVQDWVKGARLRPAITVSAILETLTEGTVTRTKEPQTWKNNLGGGAPFPSIESAQLLQSETVTPIIWSQDGILFGQVNNTATKIWILSDPDLLSNHGLHKGDNAQVVLDAILSVYSGAGPIVLDETIHGFKNVQNVWYALFTPPLLAATLQASFAIVILLWATTGRFGAPRRSAPVLRQGKETLMDNSARLLKHAGYEEDLLRRYVRLQLQDAGRRLNMPGHLQDRALEDRLKDVGVKARLYPDLVTVPHRAGDIIRSRDPIDSDGTDIVRMVYRWKLEILNGRGKNQRVDGTAAD